MGGRGGGWGNGVLTPGWVVPFEGRWKREGKGKGYPGPSWGSRAALGPALVMLQVGVEGGGKTARRHRPLFLLPPPGPIGILQDGAVGQEGPQQHSINVCTPRSGGGGLSARQGCAQH